MTQPSSFSSLSSSLSSSPRERTLADLRHDIMNAGAWVVSGLVAGMLVAVAFVFLATPYYRAAMIVAPANPMNGAGFMMGAEGPQARQDGGGASGADDFTRFETMLAGAGVAAKLLQDEKILRGLSMDRAFVFSAEFSPGPGGWSAELLAEYIDARVRLEPVGQTALRRVVYLHPSREFGVYFLHSLHRAADDILRASARAEAAARAHYLGDAIYASQNPDHRRALAALLMEQERVLMLAAIDQPYAASVVEAPAGSSKPRWPDALLIVPALMFAGALAGFMLHEFFAPRCPPVSVTIRRKGWYAPDNVNVNERRLAGRDAKDRAAE